MFTERKRIRLNKPKRKSVLFGIVRYILKLCYPKIKVVGAERLPEEPCVLVGNHAQMHGPLACEFYLPETCYTWCASPMMYLKEVPAYAYEDFWSQKPKVLRPFFKLLSYLIAPLSVLIFNNARTVPVYRDKRILTTFRKSVEHLEAGNSLVIFPEQNEVHNHIVYEFQEGFVDVARLYYKRTGRELSFVPLYIAPNLRSMYPGEPVKFSAQAPLETERRRICDELMQRITDIACNLPEHTVVPYPNLPGRLYPKNIKKEGEL